ncbi:MerR family transcriptional regulator [Vibrio proteolyticus]
MYRISELAQQVGLSRSTLLYYEKLGLITSRRQLNGYRRYSEQDAQRLKLLLQLQAAGLTLKECQACLDAQIDRELLLNRLTVLGEEIEQKQKAKELLASLLGMGSMRPWHQSIERQAPAAHLDWLIKQGLSEKQALRLKWLSQDMNMHDQYMADFEYLFEGLERLGPGSQSDSLKALAAIKIESGSVLEIGCGKGITTELLATQSPFKVTALDNDDYNLSCLKERLRHSDGLHLVQSVCASMTDLPFSDVQFDVIWSEGSAYIMGIEKALRHWQPVLKEQGYLVISDLVWRINSPDAEVRDYWSQHYPDMQTVQSRVQLFERAGFQMIIHFDLSSHAWDNYIGPLQTRIDKVSQHPFTSNALSDIQRELSIHHNYLGQYGYHFFVARRRS